MSARADPTLMKEIGLFGAADVSACFNCGNCTAICPLSKGDTVFPRKVIRYLQLGLTGQLEESPEPWLCYYCGECSATCPREAHPGEIMMATRRWLISRYDWTGISRLLYTSKAWEIGLSLVLGLIVVMLFALLHGPVVTERVELNTFAPVPSIETADWIVAALMTFFLLTNAGRMFRFTMRGVKAGLSVYLSEISTFFVHMLFQKRWRECHGPKIHWLKHFLLVTGYLTMFFLVFVFLPWFQTDGWNVSSLFGYYATAVLLYGTVDAIIGRLRRREEIHKHSHHTDWMFLFLLFSIALTGILVHVFRVVGLPHATYYAYVIHLAVDAPWLILIVPFGKWSHLLYRPLGMYLVSVRARATSTAAAGGVVPNPV